jgi:hypothetical protein
MDIIQFQVKYTSYKKFTIPAGITREDLVSYVYNISPCGNILMIKLKDGRIFHILKNLGDEIVEHQIGDVDE